MDEVNRLWFHVGSTIVMVIIAAGLYLRNRNPAWHWRIMVTAFIIDILLVLAIELTRGAVAQAMEVSEALLGFHIAVSVGVIVLYLVMFFLGRQLLIGVEARRLAHRNVGIAFVVLRSLNYITSFMV